VQVGKTQASSPLPTVEFWKIIKIEEREVHQILILTIRFFNAFFYPKYYRAISKNGLKWLKCE
jgi:hypothetical protein